MSAAMIQQPAASKPESKKGFGYLPSILDGLNSPAMPTHPRIDPSKVIGGIPGHFDEDKPFSFTSKANIGVIEGPHVSTPVVVKETAISAGEEIVSGLSKATTYFGEQIKNSSEAGALILFKSSSALLKEVGTQIIGGSTAPQTNEPGDAPTHAEQKKDSALTDKQKADKILAEINSIAHRRDQYLDRLEQETGMTDTDVKDLLHVSQDIDRRNLDNASTANEVTRLFVGRQNKLGSNEETIMDSGGGSSRAKNTQAGKSLITEIFNSRDQKAAAASAG